MTDMEYNFVADTERHINRVRELIEQFIVRLQDRATTHDHSKFSDEELTVFEQVIPKIRKTQYGSPAYHALRGELSPALAHHYANNRHHPEHFPNGIDDMTLVDVVEMFFDWVAATERHNNGDFAHSLSVNQKRFGTGDQLVRIFQNTYRDIEK